MNALVARQNYLRIIIYRKFLQIRLCLRVSHTTVPFFTECYIALFTGVLYRMETVIPGVPEAINKLKSLVCQRF